MAGVTGFEPATSAVTEGSALRKTRWFSISCAAALTRLTAGCPAASLAAEDQPPEETRLLLPCKGGRLVFQLLERNFMVNIQQTGETGMALVARIIPPLGIMPPAPSPQPPPPAQPASTPTPPSPGLPALTPVLHHLKTSCELFQTGRGSF